MTLKNMNQKATTEELTQWIEKVKTSDKIIIVEGKEDKAALKRLGITEIVQLNKKPLYKIVEGLIEQGKQVIILTDLDKKGKQLYGKLNHDLQRFGVKVDNKFRHFLFRKTKLRQIEGLDSYIERIKLKH